MSAQAEAAAKNDVFVAAAESDFRFVHLWLESSLPLDPRGDKQKTPQMAAAHAGATYMCALLVAKSANVRLQDRDGWTSASTTPPTRGTTRRWTTSARACRCSIRCTPTRSTRRR